LLFALKFVFRNVKPEFSGLKIINYSGLKALDLRLLSFHYFRYSRWMQHVCDENEIIYGLLHCWILAGTYL